MHISYLTFFLLFIYFQAILRSGGGEPSTRSLSPSPPEHRISRPISTLVRPPGKQLIPVDSISVNKTLGEGEFGVVQQAVWTVENGDKVGKHELTQASNPNQCSLLSSDGQCRIISSAFMSQQTPYVGVLFHF